MVRYYIVPVVLHVFNANFTIGGDITMSVYDAVETIQAKNFSPAMNDAST
jgi:hypothetical protein